MSDCCQDKTCEVEALQKRQSAVLWVVLLINALMFGVEFVAGLAAGSVALVSDSLDMLGDALVYAFSLYAVAEGLRTKAFSALFKGLIMATFAVVAFGQAIYQILTPTVPSYEMIGSIGLLALAANTVCFILLWRHRGDDINMSSVWLCSRNDLIANTAVICAAVGVWLSNSAWPDIIIGLGLAALFARSAITVLTGATRELRLAPAS